MIALRVSAHPGAALPIQTRGVSLALFAAAFALLAYAWPVITG